MRSQCSQPWLPCGVIWRRFKTKHNESSTRSRDFYRIYRSTAALISISSTLDPNLRHLSKWHNQVAQARNWPVWILRPVFILNSSFPSIYNQTTDLCQALGKCLFNEIRHLWCGSSFGRAQFFRLYMFVLCTHTPCLDSFFYPHVSPLWEDQIQTPKRDPVLRVTSWPHDERAWVAFELLHFCFILPTHHSCLLHHWHIHR